MIWNLILGSAVGYAAATAVYLYVLRRRETLPPLTDVLDGSMERPNVKLPPLKLPENLGAAQYGGMTAIGLAVMVALLNVETNDLIATRKTGVSPELVKYMAAGTDSDLIIAASSLVMLAYSASRIYTIMMAAISQNRSPETMQRILAVVGELNENHQPQREEQQARPEQPRQPTVVIGTGHGMVQ